MEENKKHYLEANSVLSLKWGLINFDGIETDLRVSGDNIIIIHHDPKTKQGDIIEKTEADKLRKQGVPKLADFIEDDLVISYLRDKEKEKKSFWLEIKTPCPKKSHPIASDPEKHANLLLENIDNISPVKERINFIGFNWSYLKAVKENSEYKVFPIMPTINECLPHNLMVIKALPGFFIHSLEYHVKKAIESGFDGIFFSKLYVEGALSFRHPSYEKLLKYQNHDFKLGMDVNTQEAEEKYRLIHRFTDRVVPFPRHKKEGEGDIIAHRGTGIKGVALDEKQWNDFLEAIKTP